MRIDAVCICNFMCSFLTINKFNIDLCGGDTTFSNKLSFTITSLGYSNKIIYRNKAKLNDDIYVTGNLGDSYLGLRLLSNKAYVQHKDKSFFIELIKLLFSDSFFSIKTSSVLPIHL